MRDINFIKNFWEGENNGTNFNVTANFTHDQVKQLAQRWIPYVMFHEKELFYPISINRYLYLRMRNTASSPECWVSYGNPSLLSPGPVILKDDSRNEMIDFTSDDVKLESFITNIPHNGAYDCAKKLFGSTQKIDDIQIPRFDMKLVAEFRDLLQYLKMNLLAYKSVEHSINNDHFYPFESKDEKKIVLDSIIGPPFLDTINYVSINHINRILDLIEAIEQKSPNLKTLKSQAINDGLIEYKTWDLIENCCFLEFYLIYAYNDSSPELLGNNIGPLVGVFHEGDVESVCLVFDKRCLNNQNTDDNKTVPRYAVAVGHEPEAEVDEVLQYNPYALINAHNWRPSVWVSLGSHSSKLHGAGNYSVNKNVAGGGASDRTTIVLSLTAATGAVCATMGPLECLIMIIAAAIIGHGLDTDDKTSDFGIHAIPGDSNHSDKGYPDSSVGHEMAVNAEVTPLSLEKNMYQEWNQEIGDLHADLFERSFPGKWGGSGGWNGENKTKRFLDNIIQYREKNNNAVLDDIWDQFCS